MSTITGGVPVRYPSMVGLLPKQKLNINDCINASYFQVRDCRLVIALLVHDGDAVFMIEPAKAPEDGPKLILPQEKAKYPNDTTFKRCAVRGLAEELGLHERGLAFHGDELYRFENHLPARRTSVPTTKTIVVFGVKVPKGVVFRPNAAEVRRVVRVSPDDFLDTVYGGNRPPKCVAYAEALRDAWRAKLLSHPWRQTVRLLFNERVDTMSH